MNEQLLIPLDIKTLVTVVFFMITVVGGLLRLMLHLFEKHLNERAANQAKQIAQVKESFEESFKGQEKLIDQRVNGFESAMRSEITRLSRLEAEHAALKDMLVLRFVQRDDFIRFASAIDHKIDRLGELFTRFTIKGQDHD